MGKEGGLGCCLACDFEQVTSLFPGQCFALDRPLCDP